MTQGPPELTAAPSDIEDVTRAARDYIEGYTLADPQRHLASYHPECIKRRFATDEESGVTELQVLSPRIMADYAAASDPIPDCEAEIIIDAISDGMASVRVYSCRWVDFLHVVKARGEWKLFHVTWHGR